jgi:predicted dehydrogenase
MDQPIRVAALGAARISPRALFQPARSVAGVEVTAIASRDLGRAQDLASRFEVPHASSSYAEVIEDESTDAVYVALPASLHFEWAAAALRAGKHVLCEKPVATSESEAIELAQIAEDAGRLIVEAYHYRYHPFTSRIATLLHDVVGEIVAAEVVFSHITPANAPVYWNSALGGGATLHLGGYAVDGVRAITGLELEVERASGHWINGVDALIMADLRLTGGAPLRLRSSMTSPRGFENWLWVRGKVAELLATNYIVPQFSGKQEEYAASVKVLRYGEEPLVELPDTSVLTYTLQLRAFADAIRNGTPIATSGWECAKTLRVLDTMLRMARGAL